MKNFCNHNVDLGKLYEPIWSWSKELFWKCLTVQGINHTSMFDSARHQSHKYVWQCKASVTQECLTVQGVGHTSMFDSARRCLVKQVHLTVQGVSQRSIFIFTVQGISYSLSCGERIYRLEVERSLEGRGKVRGADPDLCDMSMLAFWSL
jgi:hypothetical protein